MAGIGFELRKIWKGEMIINRIKGFAYATLVSAGPMIISVLMIVIIGEYMKQTRMPVLERDLVNAALMYAFIFAMINVSGLTMSLSRYLADQIYMKNVQHILSSLVGSFAVLTAVGSLAAFLFFAFSDLPLLFKFLAYTLFIELSSVYLLMAYLSAVKDFKKISLAFFMGIMTAICLILIIRSAGVEPTITIMASVDIGFAVSMTMMIVIIKKHFRFMSNHAFQFLHYIRRMPRLFLIGTFYTVGLFAHNIIIWLFSDLSVHLEGTYVYAPSYDNATFFAVLTIIPSTVLFVVRMETSFFETYKTFCAAIIQGGSLKAIDMAKERMLSTIKRELSNLFEAQFFVTVILIILGSAIILPALGTNNVAIGIYATLAVAYFMIQMMFIIVTILLYFDNQDDALITTGLFLGTSVLLTILLLLLGNTFCGVGLCIGAMAALIFGASRMMNMLESVDYRLFSKPPYMSEQEVTAISTVDGHDDTHDRTHDDTHDRTAHP